MRVQKFSAAVTVMAVLFLSLVMGACGGRQSREVLDSSRNDRPDRLRYGTLDLSTFDVESVDVNGDSEPDIFRYRRGGSILVERFDLNFDGRLDMTSYYDVSGQLLEQEFHLDYDEMVDVVRVYENGALVEKHVSTEFDGTYALAKYYNASGELLRIERDSDGDGLVDVWEYYDGTTLVRVGRDLDGDGRPESITDIN